MNKLLILFFLLAAPQVFAQQTSGNADQKYNQFDFWLGSWEVYKHGTDTLVGHSKIESILDGVGLLENYAVAQGQYQGKSLNKYNPARERWEQYWIDNSGLTLFLSGGLMEGRMVLDDVEHGDASKGLNKIVWEKMENGSVRQSWSVSKDSGKSWSVVFDGNYRVNKPDILGLRTCIYKVGDMQKAKKWYASAFGIEPYWDEPFYAGFNIGGYELGLMPGESSLAESAESVVTYWGVEDIDKVYRHFIESGATENEKPESVGGPLRVATVRDPWGNIIGLIYNPAFNLNQ